MSEDFSFLFPNNLEITSKNIGFLDEIMQNHNYKTHLLSAVCLFSIHPRTKLDVGYRLSRAGLAIAYGQQVEFQGPIVQNIAYSSGTSTVNITYTAVSGIELRNPNGFEVCSFLFLDFQENILFLSRFVAKAFSV